MTQRQVMMLRSYVNTERTNNTVELGMKWSITNIMALFMEIWPRVWAPCALRTIGGI